ncbi:MAG: hypothetical protein IJW36_00940 [Clostridia bacterium]|nr:hypothetical protein [Clostridia bacterium]
MIAMLAFGGTYAYFTATATDGVGTVSTAVIAIANDGTENLTMSVTENLLPYQEVTATLKLDNTSTVETWVFIELDYSVKTQTTAGDMDENTSFVLKSQGGVTGTGTTWTLVDGETNVYASNVAVEANTDLTAVLTFVFNADVNNVEAAGVPEMGATYEISVSASAIQNIGSNGSAFADAEAAWAALNPAA